MAGGEGSRLRPLTSMRPKPMVPVFNQPVMEHILGLVKHHGIDEVVATLAFLPQVIEDYFGDGSEWGMSVSYALEETPLGTAGSVKNAQAKLAGERFLVISGDALTDIDLGEVLRFHEQKGGLVTLALKSVPDPLEFGVVITDDDGRIERFLEKPSWGQVFSDTINTGIYVCEPDVLDLMPARQAFDFSNDLFPLIMRKGGALFGMVTDGYWCDIGSLETYVQAHRDVLDGAAKVHIPGIRAKGDLWIGDGADVDPEAELAQKVVIGKNVKVRAGVSLGEYTVLGDNVVVGHSARVSHSIVWDDSFVGAGSNLQGSVVCKNVDVRRRATLDQGSSVGDRSVIGHDATVAAGVQVYPYKWIEPAATVSESIIWESRASRSLFGDRGISGLVGADVTPEMALKVAQAFGTTLPAGSHVVVSRDGSRGARMLKRAVVAGLNSTGVHCRDLRVASAAVNRFTTRDSRCTGGIHVCAVEGGAQGMAELHFYRADGLNITVAEEKKVERLFFRGEFRRAFFDEVGEIIYPPRALEYYGRGLRDAIGELGSRERWIRVVADMGGGAAALIVPQVAQGWRINLVALNPIPDAERTFATAENRARTLDLMRRDMDVFAADFGVVFDMGAESIQLVSREGAVIDGDTALLAMVDLWCRTGPAGSGIAVPVTASTVVERLAEASGKPVRRTGVSRRALAEAACDGTIGFAGTRDGGYVFPSFLCGADAVMALGALPCMLDAAATSLEDVIAALPEHHLAQGEVFCPMGSKGSLMRQVTELAQDSGAELHEGVRIPLEEGWVLVLPDAVEPTIHIHAEGPDPATAQERVEQYSGIVREACG